MSPSIEPLHNFDQLRDDLLPGERISGMKARHGELARYGKIHEMALKGLGKHPRAVGLQMFADQDRRSLGADQLSQHVFARQQGRRRTRRCTDAEKH